MPTLDIVDRNERQENDRLVVKEDREKSERLNHQKAMHDYNRQAFDKLDKAKNHKKEMYQQMVEQRKKEEDDYKNFQKQQEEEDEMRRKMYREALELQKGFKDYNQNHLGQMTHTEKKMNKHDLRSFKGGKVEYEAMIPGIHNIDSVGSKPLLRKANEDVYDSMAKASPFGSNQLNNSYKDLRASLTQREGYSKNTSPARNDRYEQKKDVIGGHNPFATQNPYILKERSMIGGDAGMVSAGRSSRRSLLSSTAEKNILI